eukprot:s755_g8.t1
MLVCRRRLMPASCPEASENPAAQEQSFGLCADGGRRRGWHGWHPPRPGTCRGGPAPSPGLSFGSGRSGQKGSMAKTASMEPLAPLAPLVMGDHHQPPECTSTPTSPFSSLGSALCLARPRSAAGGQRPARSGLTGGAELAVLAAWRIRGDNHENRAKLPLPDSRASTPEAATCPAENGDAEATIPTGCADARPRSPKKEVGETEGLEHLQIEDVQCQVPLHMAPPLASPAAREQLLDESEESEAIAESQDDALSSHAWRRRDWGWSCPGRPEPSSDGGAGWPFFHKEEQTEASSEADCIDYEPCSPRPGTRQGRRNKASRAASLEDEADEAETVKGPLGWADFVSHQSWDGSDSEEEQLFAQNTAISAQELLSLDEDPEPELEGFVPRDLWVVFECDEEEELSDHQADEADEDVNSARGSEPEVEPLERGCGGCVGPRAFTLCDEEAMWTVGKASETDDTAETECMSSLAPTEFEKGVSDDDDDHNESEESLYGAQLEACAPRGGSPAEEILDGATRSKAELRGRCSGQAEGSAASLIQAACRTYLQQLKLLPLGTALCRPQRVSAETARARARRDEVLAATQLQAAWRGFRSAQVTPTQGAGRSRPLHTPHRPHSGSCARISEVPVVPMQEEPGEEPSEESDRSQELRRPPKRQSSKGSPSDGRPPSAPRGASRRRRHRAAGAAGEQVQQVQEGLAPNRSSAPGGLPRLGPLGLSGSGSRHDRLRLRALRGRESTNRRHPAPASTRAESPFLPTRPRRLGQSLSSPRRSWG